MRAYKTEAIRNVGVFSHGGAGKTSLVEAMLFNAKATTRLGRVEEGNTTTDFDPDEIKRRMSIQLAARPPASGTTTKSISWMRPATPSLSAK